MMMMTMMMVVITMDGAIVGRGGNTGPGRRACGEQRRVLPMAGKVRAAMRTPHVAKRPTRARERAHFVLRARASMAQVAALRGARAGLPSAALDHLRRGVRVRM